MVNLELSPLHCCEVELGWCSETEDIYVEHNGKYVCAEKSERLLCLEYMPKGNLRGYLSDASSGLDWDTRYKIIEGICLGLRYLHVEWKLNAPIVHMDLKPANILLDNNMVPKIADFGLSRLFTEEKTWTCTKSRDGTLGYMSPEYINRGIISTKSDIFSLGVIIIEIVTGGRDYPDETGTSSEEFIAMVLYNWSQRKRTNILYGVSLEIDYQQIRRCIEIGLDCVKTDRSKRPTISQIITELGSQKGIITTLHGLGSADSDSSDCVKIYWSKGPTISQIITTLGLQEGTTKTLHGLGSADSDSSNIKLVHKQGVALGRSVDLSKLSGYGELKAELDRMFEFEGELVSANRSWQIV